VKEGGGKLKRKQETAIAALLTEPTIGSAAARVGVGEVTLWRWLRRADFQDQYRQARREVVSQAIAALQQASWEAVGTLRQVMADSEAPATSRVSAAKAVLELALRAVELEDLQERVRALESRAEAVERRAAW